MAPRMFMASSAMATAVLVAAFLLGGASAQSTSGCTSALVSLSPCLNYITGNETAPSSSCCSQLATVVQSQPQCLCAALNGGASSLGLNINETRALGLPGACKVQTPPVSKCNTSASAPTAPSSGTPAGQTPASSGTGSGGSKTTPTTYLSSDGVSLRESVSFAVGLALVAVYGLSAM